MDILDLSAIGLSTKIKAREIGVAEALRAVLEQIERKDKTYHCYITVDAKRALQKAEEIQQKINIGELSGALAGVPIAVKDNICTRGLLTTCGSKILGNFVPPYSAEAVLKVEQAGMIIIGKTNMDEFAMGSTTETSAYGATKNPWGVTHVSGGSSGGSAAAVAARECFMALGSDTGGSIRQPAGYCGVVGMKPTYGSISRYGLVAYASSLDQIGPLAKDVSDCAAILEIMTSYDSKDSTSIERKDTNYIAALADDIAGTRIGIPKDYLEGEIEPEVKAAVLLAAEMLRGKGAVVEEFKLGLAEYAVPTYYVIASAEASSNLSRYDGIKYGYRAEEYSGLQELYKKTRSEGFGQEVKRRIMLGSFVLSSGYYEAYYLKALRTKTLIKNAFDKAFGRYDVLLAPTSQTTAPKLGESLSDPIKMYLGDRNTVAVNLAGLPAITVPCGKDSKGLPIGMQLIGDCFQEKQLLRTAYVYEQAQIIDKPKEN